MQIFLAFCATSDILSTEYVTMSVLNMYPLIMIINAGWKMPEAGQLARWVEEDDNAGARCVHHCHCAGVGNNWIPVQ